MKRLAKIAMAAAVAMMPFAANATPVDGTYSGAVTVHKGLTLNCTLTADVTNGGTQVGNLALTGPLCSLVNFNNQPYNVVHVDGDQYEIQDVDVTTITPGNCFGNIIIIYFPGPPPVIIIFGSLPASAGGGDCIIDGQLELE